MRDHPHPFTQSTYQGEGRFLTWSRNAHIFGNNVNIKSKLENDNEMLVKD